MAFAALLRSQYRQWRLLLFVLSYIGQSAAYPALIQVDEGSERCFRFNIPEDNDANVIALIIPNEDEIGMDSELEKFYVEQVYKVTKNKEKQMLSRSLPDDPPNEIAQAMSKYLQSHGEIHKVQFQLTCTPMSNPESYQQKNSLRYFTPLVVNHVARTTRARSRHRGENNMEGYGICIENKDDEKQVQVIFDMILLDDIIEDDYDASSQKQRFAKEEHLSPLENSLDQSIRSAESVLREMKFMEKRESRMRQTSESINRRVRWFSYLSISVLLSVTYVQVTYLKRYFQKKKLM